MNRIIKSTILLLIFGGLFSCQKDDSTTTEEITPLWQQEPIDAAAIVGFLTNNYFNEEEFVTPPADFNFDIKFYLDETKAEVDANGDGDILDSNQIVGSFTRTPLIDFVGTVINGMTIETKTIAVSGVDHTLYILKAVQGLGLVKPRFCDEAFLSYEGITLDKEVFDNQLNPNELDLATSIKGFSESVSEFNIAVGSPTPNLDDITGLPDGTYTYHDYGVGAVFMPSGLGYYSRSPGTISPYSPLIFKFKVYGTTELDHDNDGVPTYVEDLNGDHDLSNDDTDSDGNSNFVDANDENDPILTRDEVTNTYVIYDGDADPALLVGEEEIDRDIDYSEVPNKITITRRIYKDTDGDGVFDYLDADS